MKPPAPRNQRPALWADAMRLAVEIEQAVRGFSRDHKYTLGADMRRQAAHIWPTRRTKVINPDSALIEGEHQP